MQPLGSIIRKHGTFYADDLQLYAHFNLDMASLKTTLSKIENCISDVQACFLQNKLKMNDDKTLFIAFVPSYYNTLVDNINIKIGSLPRDWTIVILCWLGLQNEILPAFKG